MPREKIISYDPPGVGEFDPNLPDAEEEDMNKSQFKKYMEKQAPPGPPPRPGLQWKPQSRRWIRPGTEKFETWRHLEDEFAQDSTALVMGKITPITMTRRWTLRLNDLERQGHRGEFFDQAKDMLKRAKISIKRGHDKNAKHKLMSTGQFLRRHVNQQLEQD